MKYSYGIALIYFVSVYLIHEASSFSCDPKLDCQQAGLGALVPDPEDCHLYYICVKNVTSGESVPSSVSISCPAGQYFDQTVGECVTEITPCSNECYNFCYLDCQYVLEFVAFPGNCSKYYVCLPGAEKVLSDCPPYNPYFNGSDCTNDPYQCCDSCIPYCTTLFVEIADPLDCQSFYVCLSLGIPSENYHKKCPTGQHFDSSTNSCIDGASCTSLCQGEDLQTTYTTVAGTSTSSYITETDVITTTHPTTTSNPIVPTDSLTTRINTETTASAINIISSTISVTSADTTVPTTTIETTTRCHHSDDCDPNRL